MNDRLRISSNNRAPARAAAWTRHWRRDRHARCQHRALRVAQLHSFSIVFADDQLQGFVVASRLTAAGELSGRCEAPFLL